MNTDKIIDALNKEITEAEKIIDSGFFDGITRREGFMEGLVEGLRYSHSRLVALNREFA